MEITPDWFKLSDSSYVFRPELFAARVDIYSKLAFKRPDLKMSLRSLRL